MQETLSIDINLENSAILKKETFQKNADFIYRQWKPVNINGWKTFVLDIGKGRPIVFVPICQNLEVFDSLLIQHFSKKYRVITFQRRESDQQFLDIDSRSNDIKKILEYLNIDKAHFVSHSSGSVATTNLALKHTSLFLSYVWMNLSAKPMMDVPLWKRKLADLLKYLPMPENMIVSLIAGTASGNNKKSLLYQRTFEQFMAIKKTAKVVSIKNWFVNSVWPLAKYDWTEGLEKLVMPILVINSDNDLVNSVRAMGLIEKQLPNSYGYKIVRGGRHFFQYVCSNQVIEYMEEFYLKL